MMGSKMARLWSRRDVLQASTTGIVIGLSRTRSNTAAATPAESARSVSWEEARIERLAEQIMETTPDRVVDFVIGQLDGGLSRQQLMAACFHAGARFHGHHSAYVAHPIQVVANEIASETSVLPLFYYLSVLRFRAKQERMRSIDTSKLPAPQQAESFFHNAMREGDRVAAAQAMIALSRSIGPHQAYHHLWMYGAERNAISGGHAAIAVANTFRTLQATGWRCAETALQFAVEDADTMLKPRGNGVHAINRGAR